MTFEEFFNKKRIDLVALRAAEPGLFAEFEKHFVQMGEKSFDHTKKYWFNKLRLLYHLSPEQKPEKMHLENRLAEQTIVETLTENIPAPSTGFKPRFKPGMASKPAQTSDVKDSAPEQSATTTPEVNKAAETHDQSPPFEQEKAAMQQMANETPRTTDGERDEKQIEKSLTQKPAGFKPRFNKITQGTAPQTKEFNQQPEVKNDTAGGSSAKDNKAPKPAGFKPRFNMKTMAAKPAEEKVEPDVTAPAAKPADAGSDPVVTPKIGFKPRFNAKAMAPESVEPIETTAEPEQTTADGNPEDVTEPGPPAETPATPKIGFKPRFNAKAITPKYAEPIETKAEPEQTTADGKPEDVTEPGPPAETPATPKIGFKPRFNAKTTKPQPPQE
jgi:hypothetical protein